MTCECNPNALIAARGALIQSSVGTEGLGFRAQLWVYVGIELRV